ncbi:GTPase-activating protein skywalker [Lamellibrachia satsuma]|nr:GTPase-activating protein skywalker [Lamellibrachia satsuma]
MLGKMLSTSAGTLMRNEADMCCYATATCVEPASLYSLFELGFIQLMNLLAINAAMAPIIKGLCGSRFSVTIYSGYGSAMVGSCLLLKEARERNTPSIVHKYTAKVDETEHSMCLPQFVDPSFMHSYHLSSRGTHVAKKVVCVVGSTCPDIVFSPTIYGLTTLLLHYQSEEESYNCIYGVVRDKQASLPQTKTAFEASKYILKDLARKYAKPMCQYISKHGLQIEGILEGWVWWVFHDLPFEYLVRIMDCFLMEGCKVLYRTALAILILYHRHMDTWVSLTTRTSVMTALAILILYHRHMVRGAEHKVDSDLARSISQFCEDIPVSVDDLFKLMFGLRGLSRKLLQSLTVKKEMYVKSLRRSNAIPQSIPQSVSCDTLNLQVAPSVVAPMVAAPTAAAPIDMQELADIGSSLVTPQQHCVRSRARSLGFAPFTNLRSAIIAARDWQDIWGWLPMRVTLLQPELVYTTAEHGTSLNTFFLRVDGEEPSLLLIKTTKNEILGAYCSVDWAVRKDQRNDLSYFGTGETFVFTLFPERKKYGWVGISLGEQTRSTAHMFMAANKKTLLIGGGSGIAIQLDEDLFQGRTERSDTFGNLSLLSESDFKCSIVEVYAFH